MNKLAYIKYQLPCGTSGGTAVMGNQKLPFNTVIKSEFSGFCLFADGTFELTKGEYIIECDESVNKVGGFETTLFDYTNNCVVGGLNRGNHTSLGEIKHRRSLKLTVLKEKAIFGILLFCEFERLLDGFGVPKDEDSCESYNEAKIWRL